MAKSDDGPLETRTYSVEEVGAMIRRATAEKAAPAAAPIAGHDRLAWPEVVDIAADLDISETALRRAATPDPPAPPKTAPRAPATAQAAEPAAAAVPPTASADPRAEEKRWFFHRAAHCGLTLAVLGAVDLLVGTHGAIFAVGALVCGLRLGRQAIRLWLGPPPRAALPGGPLGDWRALRRAERHARRADRHARMAERHARRAERYKL